MRKSSPPQFLPLPLRRALLCLALLTAPLVTPLLHAADREIPGAYSLVLTGRLELELTEFLARQNGLLEAGDTESYLQAFTDPETRSDQNRMMTLYKIAPAKNLAFSLPAPQSVLATDRNRLFNVSLYMDYMLDDVVLNIPFRSLVRCDLVKDPDSSSWRITQFKTPTSTPFWLYGLTDSVADGHFRLFCIPESPSSKNLRKLHRDLESAYKKLSKHKGLRLDERYPVFLVDSSSDFSAITNKDSSRFIAAASAAYTEDSSGLSVTNQAMYINSALFLSRSSVSGPTREEVLMHEIVHLALAKHTRSFTPAWVSEGTATYFSGELGIRASRALYTSGAAGAITLSGLSRGSLTGDRFGSQLHLNLEYTYAAKSVAYLIKEFGEEKFLEFYRSFADMPRDELDDLVRDMVKAENGRVPIPILMHRLSELMTERHFGITLYELDNLVKASIIESR